MINYRSHLILKKSSIREALTKLNILGIDAILFVTDKDDKLIGSITDGDVRRSLVKGVLIDQYVDDILSDSPKFIRKGEYDLDKLINYREENYRVVPILDEDDKIINVLNFRHQISYLPIDAVIMAGGRGQRLIPLTNNTPKPLLEVGEKSIIEHNLDRLCFFGIDNFWISINYLGNKIVDKLGKGYNRNITINYLNEDQPLGTIGSISKIREFNHDYVLVTNSDILTNLDYEDFFIEFIKSGADMGVVSIPYKVEIPYAVLEIKDKLITNLKEKPTYTYYSNAGIYLFRKSVLKLIPKNTYYDATDFMQNLINKDYKIFSYAFAGYWLDIGRHEDFVKANNEINSINFNKT